MYREEKFIQKPEEWKRANASSKLYLFQEVEIDKPLILIVFLKINSSDIAWRDLGYFREK